MSAASPRKSLDSLPSGASTPSLPSQYSSSQLGSPRELPRKYALRRGSTASSIVSIGGILDPSFHHASIAESGQNAISTLLQNPIVRTGLVPHTAATTAGFKAPTSRDIPPVTLSNIRNVDATAFQPYLSQVGSLYDAFQQAKESRGESDTQLARELGASPKIDEAGTWMSKPLDRRQSSTSSISLVASPLDVKDRKRPAPTRRGHSVTPLSTIPSIYFDDDFHLENPRVFDVVSEKSEVVRPPPKPTSKDERIANGAAPEAGHTGRKALATNAILQEKLSWYMDTVEIHLISSISSASKSFFTALGSLRELHSEAADSVKRIQVLRSDLQKIDKEMALGGLKIVNLRCRRENVRMLADAVSQLQQVVDSVSRCEEWIEQGNIQEAADGLDDVEKLMAGEDGRADAGQSNFSRSQLRKRIDLRHLRALEGASVDIAQLRSRIGMGFEARFLNDLLGDLRQHVEKVSSQATLQRWGASFQRQRGLQRTASSSTPAYLEFDEQLRSNLRSQLRGLARAHHTTTATTSFKTAVLKEMKSLIRKHLPSSSDDDNESMVSVSTHGDRQLSQQEKSTILARNLRALDAEDASLMLTRIYTGVSESLRRLSGQVKILLDIASGLADPSTLIIKSPPRSPNMKGMGDGIMKPGTESRQSSPTIAQDEILQVLDMSSLLGQAVDIVQLQITKVLKVRSEQTAQLSLKDFLRYFTLNRLFADECEAISGRSGTALKTLVGNQIKDYISRFGDNQRHHIVEVMDSDKWEAKDFGDIESTILTRIFDSSTRDIEVWSDVCKIWITPVELQQTPLQTNGTVAVNGSSKEKTRSAIIDEEKYILPDSALVMMKSIEQFQLLMTNIPSMIPEIGLNLLESLRLFNSRSSQLILGAGATRSAGLKNITTKHLAISSQALSFIIALIPYIREFIRRHSPASPLMAEFDKLKRLYQEHQSGIQDKLADIMSSRSAIHVNVMKKIDWDATTDSNAVNSYMETLTKETGTLHRVLSRHLPESTVIMIMGPIFNSYRDQWSKAIEEATVRTEAGRKRMKTDFDHFKSKVSKISGAEDLGDQLLRLVDTKTIASPPAQESQGIDSPPQESSPPPGSEEEWKTEKEDTKLPDM